jgi:hypothetical protein
MLTRNRLLAFLAGVLTFLVGGYMVRRPPPPAYPPSPERIEVERGGGGDVHIHIERKK